MEHDGKFISTLEAAKNNFVRVHVGNIDPYIHRNDDNFSFGLKDKKDYENIGSVNCGVWAVTIIEKQNLINIVSNKVEIKEAELLVENYLNSKNHTIHLTFDLEKIEAKEFFTLKKDKIVKAKKDENLNFLIFFHVVFKPFFRFFWFS